MFCYVNCKLVAVDLYKYFTVVYLARRHTYGFAGTSAATLKGTVKIFERIQRFWLIIDIIPAKKAIKNVFVYGCTATYGMHMNIWHGHFTCPLCTESIWDRLIPRMKAARGRSMALWDRCCCWPQEYLEQTVVLPMIWDDMTLEWHHCNCVVAMSIADLPMVQYSAPNYDCHTSSTDWQW